MAADELRTDPFAWALAKHHVQVVAPRQAKTRRRRLTAMLLSASLLAVIASWIGVSTLSADAPPAAWIEAGSDGGASVGVNAGASEREMIDELRALLRKAELDIEVDSYPVRGPVAGRLLPEGDGMTLVDRDPALDNTGTRIELAADATGTILVTTPAAENETQLLPGLDMRCAVRGLSLAEARRIVSGAGFEISIPGGFDVAETSVVADALTQGSTIYLFFDIPLSDQDC